MKQTGREFWELELNCREQRGGRFFVPMNEVGEQQMLSYVEDPENILFFYITTEQNDAIFWTYTEINHALDIIIDYYEDEVISAADAPKALEIVNRRMSTAESDAEHEGLEGLACALEAAMQYDTYVEISL